jgi:hypothetical protein
MFRENPRVSFCNIAGEVRDFAARWADPPFGKV